MTASACKSCLATGINLGDSDFYPFGGQRPAVTFTSGNNYKFTSKERDAKTGLDCLEARYFSGAPGRFTSVDPEEGLRIQIPRHSMCYL